MVTSEKFENSQFSYRARLYSAVVRVDNLKEKPIYCLSFKYNIFSESDDGFNVQIENYLNPDQRIILFNEKGPLAQNRWYSAQVSIRDIKYQEFRVIKFLKTLFLT